MKDAPRTAEAGDHGPDVLAYKIELREKGLLPSSDRITNKFAGKMEDAVKAFQREQGIKVTGKVNQATFDALRPGFNEFQDHLIQKYATAHTERTFVLPIVHHEPARTGQFSVGHMDPVRAVLHDTESHDVPRSISDLLGVINYWKNNPYPSGTLNGAHYLDDRDGFIAQIGTLADILQHVQDANTGSVGIEQVGFASFGGATWLARGAQLDATAKILAYLNKHHNIPLVLSTDRGVSTHAMMSIAKHIVGGHTDPGRFYPKGRVIKRARLYVAAGGWVVNN
jgi:hypothetical protein